MIERYITETLQSYMSGSPAVVLLGARQVGKTTLAKIIGKQLDAVYLDLESPEDLIKLNEPGEFFRSQKGRLIILDEIQQFPNLFKILRGVIDQKREDGNRSQQFLLLGSASMDLLRQSSETLAGRIYSLEMTGFNVFEVAANTQDLKKLWFRGGFPESYLSEGDDQATIWLENLIRTYLERDVPQIGFHVPANRLRRFWTMLAHMQGETVNASKLASNLEVQRSTVNQYIDILVDLLLVRRIDPWHANVKKRLVKSSRYYIRDSGILHRLLGINSYDALLSNPILGKSWEGFVIENIHSILPNYIDTYFYRTAAGAEIDLVIRLSDTEVWAIEIKHGNAPKINKHYSQICEDVAATKKYIIYGGDDEFSVSSDVTMISLSIFMERLKKAVSG